jgi:hypothetical protein
MNRALNTLRLFMANLLWLLSCLPGLIAFLLATGNPKRAQSRVLTRILRHNATTAIGRAHRFQSSQAPEGFSAMPLSEYEDYAEWLDRIRSGQPTILTNDPVELLQPTSGSATATKLIPYTRSLRQAFGAAIDPWIASLYLCHPSLLFGRHYWSISPNTRPPQTAPSRIRVGFADDAEYLTRSQQHLSRVLFAVPPEIAQVADPDAFEHLTLLFLMREHNLRLISVWHPSFLCLLIKAIPRRLQAITRAIESGTIGDCTGLPPALRTAFEHRLTPDPARAAELRRIDTRTPDFPSRIWPRLRVISCWTSGWTEPWLDDIRQHFPRAIIQAKGLTATEGIVSFPVGRKGRKACAIRSHFLEFIDQADGGIRRAWEIAPGRDYSVVLTTQGGLYRYRLHDTVRVTGFFLRTPCIEFVTRDNLVSDLVGEKLNGSHVEDCIRATETALGIRFSFALLAPCIEDQSAGYVFFAQSAPEAVTHWDKIRDRLELELSRNFHYHHASERSQLQPLRIFRIDGDATDSYRRHLMRKGTKAGDVKFCTLSRHTDWTDAFTGTFAEPRGSGSANLRAVTREAGTHP